MFQAHYGRRKNKLNLLLEKYFIFKKRPPLPLVHYLLTQIFKLPDKIIEIADYIERAKL